MLHGFNSVFSTTLNNELQDNLVEFFDWGLLEKGNYFNATLGELSPRSQDYSLLKLSSNDHDEYGCGEINTSASASYLYPIPAYCFLILLLYEVLLQV